MAQKFQISHILCPTTATVSDYVAQFYGTYNCYYNICINKDLIFALKALQEIKSVTVEVKAMFQVLLLVPSLTLTMETEQVLRIYD
jgi:hypothetical protein